MAEYLKRDDVLSNADIITVQTREYGNIDVIPVEYLADLPTADVVEVIRCKDCRYCDLEGRCEAPENGLTREYVKPDDFCSYGERRTDDEM